MKERVGGGVPIYERVEICDVRDFELFTPHENDLIHHLG